MFEKKLADAIQKDYLDTADQHRLRQVNGSKRNLKILIPVILWPAILLTMLSLFL